jgi:excisionase family DNA binding protein
MKALLQVGHREARAASDEHDNFGTGDGIMAAERVIDFDRGGLKSSQQENKELSFKPQRRKPPQRVTVAPEDKLLVSREEAAQLLSISQRGLDYLVASKRLPTRRIGGRVLIPVAELRKYARYDHPENIVAYSSDRTG